VEDKKLITSISLKIDGSFGLISQPVSDVRGTLIRIWENSLIPSEFKLKQASIVSNPTSFTLRGLHYQKTPFSETKIIQCTSGKVFDVILDLRKKSSTYGEYITVEIGPSCEYQGLVVPAGCAHGYITLESNSTLIYFMDTLYSAENSCGILWNDPNLKINWPREPIFVSDKDSAWPLFDSLN
jgi:dTDP-4-dehydrorhamnose 3,5-epimerase